MLQVLCDRLAAGGDLIHHRRSQEDATGTMCPSKGAGPCRKSEKSKKAQKQKRKAKRRRQRVARNQNRRQFVV
jgi:hypothetical protein